MCARLMKMAAVTTILILLASASGNAETVCYFYEDSKVVELGDGHGPGCALTGAGCNECITTASRG